MVFRVIVIVRMVIIKHIYSWYRSKFNYEIKKEWIVKTPGVVFALAQAVRAFTKLGDGVIIQTPVYYPFKEVIIDNGRRVITNSLVLKTLIMK